MALKKIDSEQVIDLRSDTTSPVSKEMRESICKAKTGDELYGDDPSTDELEKYCANLFKKEAAIFVPSGIMANQIAIRCHTLPGDSILFNTNYHLYYYESASVADLSKAALYPSDNKDGLITSHDILSALDNTKYHSNASKITLLWLENTIAALGGKAYPLNFFLEACNVAKKYNLSTHLDGARLLNACISTGIEAHHYSQAVDSLTLSFTKGLGAPFGALLLGSHAVINKAKKFKKWYGGGMHQSGLMAAGCLYAIKNNLGKINADHEHAKLFANIILKDKRISIFPVETNIILMDISKLAISTEKLCAKAKSLGVLLYPWSSTCMRAVMHSGIDHKSATLAAKKLLSLFSKN